MSSGFRVSMVVFLTLGIVFLRPGFPARPGQERALPEPVIPPDAVYKDVEHVYSAVEALCRSYPIIVPLDAGKSQVGKLPIPAFRVGSGPCALLLVGGIHGDEWPVVGTVLYMAEQYARALSSAGLGDSLSDAGEAEPYEEVRRVFDGRSVVVIPVLNPDGLGRSRYNGRGVDLNRNFDSGWARAVGRKGASPESESESRFLADLTRRENPEVVMAFHCFLDCVFWTYDQEGERLERDERVARSVMEAYGDLLSGGLKAYSPAESAHGGYKDWFIKEFGRPGFTVETPGRDRFGTLENMVKSGFWLAFQEASVRAGTAAVRTFLER